MTNVKILRYFLFTAFLLCIVLPLSSQNVDSIAFASLKTIDPGLMPYFPRWKICEPNLQLQITQVFKLDGRSKDNLDSRSITVTAAPLQTKDDSDSDDESKYIILLIECGS